ncbi:MAG: exosortase system-associated protein, TIGR04073 family [Chthoniobacterales bacterium]
MKNLIVFAFIVGFACVAAADIQDPPSNDHGPTRKLGRGVSNVLFGWSEIPHTIAQVNEREGNSAAGGYGVVRGVGRAFMRFGTGVFDVVTFPFPAVRGTYYPPLPDDTRYIHAGFQEFPPELGYESKYEYVRHY